LFASRVLKEQKGKIGKHYMDIRVIGCGGGEVAQADCGVGGVPLSEGWRVN